MREVVVDAAEGELDDIDAAAARQVEICLRQRQVAQRRRGVRIEDQGVRIKTGACSLTAPAALAARANGANPAAAATPPMVVANSRRFMSAPRGICAVSAHCARAPRPPRRTRAVPHGLAPQMPAALRRNSARMVPAARATRDAKNDASRTHAADCVRCWASPRASEQSLLRDSAQTAGARANGGAWA